MLASEKLAIAAHLHVLLRRKTGRVTDTQWMANNQEYAADVVRFARRSAAEDGHTDLAEWADKLEQAMFAAPVQRPRDIRPQVVPSVMPTLRSLLASNASNAPHAEAGDSQFDSARYVRGLR
nr:hypothetical protein [Rhodoferax sp.]